MKQFFQALTLAVLLTGCIMPKPIEFGQDKVEKFPTIRQAEKEIQRQTAQRAAVKADETFKAAIATAAEPEVIKPAAEASVLTESVATSLGPPIKPASETVTSVELAKQLDTTVAKLTRRIDNFRADNDENAGKKIEGTGFMQMSYFTYLFIMAGVLVGAVVVWRIGKLALSVYAKSNPGVAVGLRAVQAGGALASKAVGQLIAGGERFKEKLATDLHGVDDEVKARIEKLFLDAHKHEHDADVKDVVKSLIK